MSDSTQAGAGFDALVALIARLRGPGGCPWDREQTHASLKSNAIEEAYELVEAIEAGDDAEIRGELGDLLLQVVFHAQIASEQRRFDIGGVVAGVSDKMIRRHPHVFADASAADSGQVLRNWEELKDRERPSDSMLDSVSRSLPATLEAFQMTTKAARVGFDWPDAAGVLDKLDEEAAELRRAVGPPAAGARQVEEEVGDLLFTAVNVARRLGVDPESALKAANRKFRTRFGHVERELLARGRKPAGATLAEMEGLWQEAKAQEGRGR